MALHDFQEAVDFASDYLKECGGSRLEFYYRIGQGERLGQAFFNSLSGLDQEFIRGMPVDPFYKNYFKCIYDAIEFLMGDNKLGAKSPRRDN